MIVNQIGGPPRSSRGLEVGRTRWAWNGDRVDERIFRDPIKKKELNILRIGFQNVGGFSIKSDSFKDDIVRCGISQYDFDIFGFAETNVDWCLVSEEGKLPFKTKGWWDA
jgi:hypothetical protein